MELRRSFVRGGEYAHRRLHIVVADIRRRWTAEQLPDVVSRPSVTEESTYSLASLSYDLVVETW